MSFYNNDKGCLWKAIKIIIINSYKVPPKYGSNDILAENVLG